MKLLFKNLWFVILFFLISFAVNAQDRTINKTIYKQKKTWVVTNPFKTDVFIENAGQFDNWAKTSKKIKYVINNGDGIFFTQNGLTFKLEKVEKTNKEESEKKGEENESGGKVETFYASMEWEGSNTDVKIEVSGETENYYTYGEKGFEI